MQNSHITGYIAIASFFIFTGIGACAQVYKLIQRTRALKRGELELDQVCEGLHPVREMWSFSAFLFFALSGLTRTYLDYFLLLSRFPVIILSTVILWFLKHHKLKGADKFFYIALLGNAALISLTVLAISGYSFSQSILPRLIDGTLGVVSLLLFYGKMLQATTMYRNRRSQAVSWLRESGLVVKDLTGLWYSITVGSELFWVSVTHILSALSSFSICLVKFVVERARK